MYKCKANKKFGRSELMVLGVVVAVVVVFVIGGSSSGGGGLWKC